MNIENIGLVINQWNIFEHVAQALSKKKHTVNESLDPKFLEQTTKLAHDFLRNKKIWSPCTWLFWHTEHSIWQRHTKRGCISLIRFIVSGCDRIGSQHFIRQYVLFGTFGIKEWLYTLFHNYIIVYVVCFAIR